MDGQGKFVDGRDTLFNNALHVADGWFFSADTDDDHDGVGVVGPAGIALGYVVAGILLSFTLQCYFGRPGQYDVDVGKAADG